jgi:membrane fusion protein, heavy metal efflux system
MNKQLLTLTLSAIFFISSSNAFAEDEHDNDGHHETHQHQTEAEHDEHDHAAEVTENSSDHSEQEDKSHDEDGHGDHEAHGDEELEENGVALSASQRSLADIEVQVLEPRKMDYQVYAPGEIQANGYTNYLVSPRVESVVLKRHVTLGEHVEKGQALVTLFSETVADSQAAYRVAQAEWQRVKLLGKKAVGDKRYVTARSGFEATQGKLTAFGLSKQAIKDLPKKKSTVLGVYTLNASTSGAVLSDDFHQGQLVAAGGKLMEVADEQELWVEARISPQKTLKLPAGTQALVKVAEGTFQARVAQEAHIIDQKSRTRVIRLLVDNSAHRLHPGLFADVYFSFTTKTPVLAVPESALMRGADGDWTVFVEQEPGQFKAHEVELGRSFGKWREVSGIAAGHPVVMKGAFFVASQIAKSGFDPHDH